MPASITLLLVFAMLATTGALCIRIALRRRRASGAARRGALVAGADGMDAGWSTSSTGDASSSSAWTGGGGESGGAGATGGWDSETSDTGTSDGGGDGGGGGD